MVTLQHSQKPFASNKLLEKDIECQPEVDYPYMCRILFYLKHCYLVETNLDFNSRKYKIMSEFEIYQLLTKVMKANGSIKPFLMEVKINDIIQSRSEYFLKLINRYIATLNTNPDDKDRIEFQFLCFGNEIMSSEVTRVKKNISYKSIDDDIVFINVNMWNLKQNYAELLFDLL